MRTIGFTPFRPPSIATSRVRKFQILSGALNTSMALIASFTASHVGKTVTVTSTSTSDNPIVEYQWAWGEGDFLEPGPETATHTYAIGGKDYLVTLWVRDSSDAVDAIAQWVAAGACIVGETKTETCWDNSIITSTCDGTFWWPDGSCPPETSGGGENYLIAGGIGVAALLLFFTLRK